MFLKRVLLPIITALAVLFGTVLTAAPARADELISDQQSIRKAADWIKGEWDEDRFGNDAGLLADGIMALSSAGMHHDTIDQMLATLKSVGPAYVTNRADAVAKVLLTADMAGVADPAHFLGPDRDLVAELLAHIEAERVRQAWGGYLSVIALERLGRLGDVSPEGMSYLMGRMAVTQDGGFGWSTSSATGDPDYTGVGISAMLLLTRSDDVSASVKSEADTRLANAIAWAGNETNQRLDEQRDYYWIASPMGTDGASSNSTGMLASALSEAGVNTESPKKAMKREQAATTSGAAWSNIRMGKKDDLRATAQAIFAITGTGYATAKLAPRILVTRITLPATLALLVGKAQTLTATIAPSNATNQALTWASSNPGVATVNAAGTVTAVKAGTATITATAADGSGVKATSTVTVTAPVVPETPFDVYITDGTHNINGRLWRTKCSPYSSTVDRCRTDIQATTVAYTGGRFVQKTDWVFNNLTYKASPRADWAKNPLGAYGKVGGTARWTGDDGRQWRTECDTATTGRGGCRTYATATIVEAYTTSSGARAYRWVTREILNNMVRFS